jgi:hypothetical protein
MPPQKKPVTVDRLRRLTATEARRAASMAARVASLAATLTAEPDAGAGAERAAYAARDAAYAARDVADALVATYAAPGTVASASDALRRARSATRTVYRALKRVLEGTP